MRKGLWILGLWAGAAMLAGCSYKEKRSMPDAQTERQEAEQFPYDEPLPEDYEGTLTMWGWDEDYYRTITEAFQKKYPNVTFSYTSINHGELAEKYGTALLAEGELPDVGWSIIDSRGEIFELDMWEPLEQEPYCFDLSEVFDYLHPRLVNTKGNVCGIEQSLSPAGLAYRRDLAKKYLGTDDPEELEAMMPDWDSFIEKGREVYEKSGGQVYMCFSLGDLRQFFQEQQEIPWCEGKSIDVEKNFGKTMDLVCRFRDERVSDNLVAWTPEWNKAYGEDNHIFTTCAAWAVQFTIISHDPEGKNLGHWGLMSAPEGNVNLGGTTMGITRTCKDKRLAWEFIKFATLSTEGAQALNSLGLMTPARKPYEECPELKSYKSPWFGDQDIGLYYMDKIVPNIKTRLMTPEDRKIHDSQSLVLNVLNNDRTVTAEEGINMLREELREAFPDFQVD